MRKGDLVSSLDKQTALRLLTLFSAAVKGMAFYPASHPAIRQPLTDLYRILTAAFPAEEHISWGVMDGIMLLDDHLFIEPSTAIADLTNRMTEKEIRRIVITPSLRFDELELFVKLFSSREARFDSLSHQLAEQGITSLTLVQSGDIGADDDNDDLQSDNVRTYNTALTAIRTICHDIERGRIPNSAPLIKVVDQMVRTTMEEPWALLGLTMIKDYDDYTYTHCVNVGVLAMALGSTLGLDAATVRDLGIAGQLHDIGKTMIPKEILNKPGKFSSAEFDEMKRHPELGAKITREMEGLSPLISSAVHGHHLHYNRSGYPESAKELPFNQMIDIIAIADTYDAITTMRVYQHPVNPKAALNAMQRMANTILDGTLVGRFVEMMGTYPVGTLVRLDTNEVAIVSRPNPLDDTAPLVQILIDGDGQPMSVAREQALTGSDGSQYATIVAVVDPLLKNIDIGQLFASGHY